MNEALKKFLKGKLKEEVNLDSLVDDIVKSGKFIPKERVEEIKSAAKKEAEEKAETLQRDLNDLQNKISNLEKSAGDKEKIEEELEKIKTQLSDKEKEYEEKEKARIAEEQKKAFNSQLDNAISEIKEVKDSRILKLVMNDTEGLIDSFKNAKGEFDKDIFELKFNAFKSKEENKGLFGEIQVKGADTKKTDLLNGLDLDGKRARLKELDDKVSKGESLTSRELGETISLEKEISKEENN